MTVANRAGWTWLGILLAVPWIVRGFAHSTAAFGVTLADSAVLIAATVVVAALEQAIVAVVARCLGGRVLVSVLGIGPRLFRRTFRRLYFQVNLTPLFGWSAIATKRVEGCWLVPRFASTAVLTAIAIGVACTQPDAMHPPREALAPVLMFVTAVGLTVATSLLVTFAFKPATRRSWHALGLATSAIEAIGRGAYEEAVAICRRGLELHPNDLALELALASALSERAPGEALAITTRLRQRIDLLPEARASVANSYAWCCNILGRDDLRDEADRASLEAVSLEPKHSAYLDTRGHVLLWLKRHREAEPLLLAGYRSNARHGRACSAAGMALLCTATDRPDEARTWLARARAEDLELELVARAIAAVEPLSRR